MFYFAARCLIQPLNIVYNFCVLKNDINFSLASKVRRLWYECELNLFEKRQTVYSFVSKKIKLMDGEVQTVS